MLVYLLGMFPIGIWQGSIRSALGDLPALAAVIFYIFILRLLGTTLVRFIDFRRRQAIMAHNQAVDFDRRKWKISDSNAAIATFERRAATGNSGLIAATFYLRNDC
jgi:hypothetical protein